MGAAGRQEMGGLVGLGLRGAVALVKGLDAVVALVGGLAVVMVGGLRVGGGVGVIGGGWWEPGVRVVMWVLSL